MAEGAPFLKLDKTLGGLGLQLTQSPRRGFEKQAVSTKDRSRPAESRRIPRSPNGGRFLLYVLDKTDATDENPKSPVLCYGLVGSASAATRESICVK